MKKIFGLMLTILMIFSFVFIVSASETTEAEASYVAQVGDVKYATIDEAVAAWKNGTTLTLLSDVTLTDVIIINSNESRYLNLGTYTMTAASGKNAIQIVCQNMSKATNCLTINADAQNPGGITAEGMSCIYYKKTTSTQDRPIITFNGGIFNGKITSSSANRGTNTPQFVFRGGVFNKTVSLGHSLVIVYGGTFHSSFSSTGDSSSYRRFEGGRFKQFGFMTNDASNKFTIGSSKSVFDVGLYVDKEGYLVIGGPVIKEADSRFEAHSENYSGWNSSLKFSSAATYGLYYETVEEAFSDNNKKTGVVTVHTDILDLKETTYLGSINVGNDVTDLTVDLTGSTYAGKINITNDETIVSVVYEKKAEPQCSVASVNAGKIIIYSDMIISTLASESTDIAVRNYFVYDNIQDAIDAALDGDIIELMDNISVDTTIIIPEGKTVTISLKGFSIDSTSQYAFEVNGNLTIEGNGTINGGILATTDASLTINNVTISSQTDAIKAEGAVVVIENATVTGAISGTKSIYTIKNGTFDSTLSNENGKFEITGGTFTKPVSSDLLASGYVANESNGSYVVAAATMEDLIVFNGYSYSELDNSIIAGYTVNKALFNAYCQEKGITINLGVVYAADQIDENAIYKSLAGYELTTYYNIKLKNIKEANFDRAFAMALYIEIDGEKQFVTADANGKTVYVDALEVQAITYNTVVKKEENE